MYTDIRWKQRFQNFEKAITRLQNAIDRYNKTPNDELIMEGMTQTYEFTYELGINTIKDFLDYEGIIGLTKPRDIIKKTYK